MTWWPPICRATTTRPVCPSGRGDGQRGAGPARPPAEAPAEDRLEGVVEVAEPGQVLESREPALRYRLDVVDLEEPAHLTARHTAHRVARLDRAAQLGRDVAGLVGHRAHVGPVG